MNIQSFVHVTNHVLVVVTNIWFCVMNLKMKSYFVNFESLIFCYHVFMSQMNFYEIAIFFKLHWECNIVLFLQRNRGQYCVSFMTPIFNFRYPEIVWATYHYNCGVCEISKGYRRVLVKLFQTVRYIQTRYWNDNQRWKPSPADYMILYITYLRYTFLI